MALSTRRLKSRLKSVTNTRKITKAMELVAGAKMRRAVQMALDSRPYSGALKRIVEEIRPLIDQRSHPLMYGRPEAKKTLLIVAASDRGMCGGFNTQLVRKVTEFVKTRTEPVTAITMGKKVESAIRRLDLNILASFSAASNAPSFDRVTGLGQMAYDEFLSGRVDRVFLCYSDFKSAVSQVPTIVQLLPVIPENELQNVPEEGLHSHEEELSGMTDTEKLDWERRHAQRYWQDYTLTFEPSPRYVLDHMLPRLIDTRLYQATLESSASEQSARMMAMRSATDAATEMIDSLSLTYNQARQAGITREISEISAGKATLEQ